MINNKKRMNEKAAAKEFVVRSLLVDKCEIILCEGKQIRAGLLTWQEIAELRFKLREQTRGNKEYLDPSRNVNKQIGAAIVALRLLHVHDIQ